MSANQRTTVRIRRGERRAALRASVVVAAFAALSQLPAIQDAWAVAPCSAYVRTGLAYAYCVRAEARAESDPARASRICDFIHTESATCRQLWVYDRLRRGTELSSEVLRGVCASDDCRFDVVETRALPGENENECVGHAAERWFWSKPSVDDILGFQRGARDWPTVVGTITGAALACASSDLPCEGEQEVRRACHAGRQAILNGIFPCSSPPFYLPERLRP